MFNKTSPSLLYVARGPEGPSASPVGQSRRALDEPGTLDVRSVKGSRSEESFREIIWWLINDSSVNPTLVTQFVYLRRSRSKDETLVSFFY